MSDHPSADSMWEPARRPPADQCPKKFCFHWIPPGGMADMTGKEYSSLREALATRSNWTPFPDGGCSCMFGPCTRLDPVNGSRDHYEPCEPELLRAGLPWFYFSTLENLHPKFHEQFLRESQAHWATQSRENDAETP